MVEAVFFDIEKAYDMLWKEGLLIKPGKLGIGGRLYNWVLDFFVWKSNRGKGWGRKLTSVPSGKLHREVFVVQCCST